MTRRGLARRAALGVLVLGAATGVGAACSNLHEESGVIGLAIEPPAADSLQIRDTLQLRARALDRNGDSVAAEIEWVTNAPAFAVVDAQGRVTGVGAGTVQVQAHVGGLYTAPVNLRIVPGPDSLAVGAQELTVASAEAGSAPLVALLLSGAPPAAPLAGGRLVYEVVSPAFADPAQRSVQLGPGGVLDTVTTGTDGQPVTPVTLDRVPGIAAPESAVVEVRSQWAVSGRPVAGSGQQFVVRFQP
ncbi:MAG TPA: Ig-like domain-containing protein [Gemmatimonadales bacterium]|nr:Ig-like domain-containing protein [Gemmatimonadales bacterium]